MNNPFIYQEIMRKLDKILSKIEKYEQEFDEIEEELKKIAEKEPKTEISYFGSYSPCIGDRHEMGG